MIMIIGVLNGLIVWHIWYFSQRRKIYGTWQHKFWIKINRKARRENTQYELMVNLHDLNLATHILDDCPYCAEESKAKIEIAVPQVQVKQKPKMHTPNKWIYDPKTDLYNMYETFEVTDGDGNVIKTYQERTQATPEMHAEIKRAEHGKRKQIFSSGVMTMNDMRELESLGRNIAQNHQQQEQFKLTIDNLQRQLEKATNSNLILQMPYTRNKPDTAKMEYSYM